MTMRVLSVLSFCFMLAGCGGTAETAADQVAKIQAKANQICGYVDQVGAVAKIVAVGLSGQVPAGVVLVTGVDATAKAICAALKPKTVSALTSACAQVNGVCLK